MAHCRFLSNTGARGGAMAAWEQDLMVADTHFIGNKVGAVSAPVLRRRQSGMFTAS